MRTIQLSNGVLEAEVSILDVAGRLWLQSSKVNDQQIRIVTGQLPAGVYFVTVRTVLGQRTLRFVR
ncbi:hypothetical protein CEQ90_16135 [Lewinellaceae bacterium SD302]|nr:hypothetical protein CEQ90_16135 [Lewinellaceae bacterium SD302]